MAVTKKVKDIVTVHRLINTAKLGKMEDAEKYAIIKVARQIKKVGTEFDDFLKDVQEKMKPEGFDSIISKVQKNEKMTSEESEVLNKYNNDVAECLKDELDKEVELAFEPMTEEAIGRFVASNDFSMGEIFAISDVIGE